MRKEIVLYNRQHGHDKVYVVWAVPETNALPNPCWDVNTSFGRRTTYERAGLNGLNHQGNKHGIDAVGVEVALCTVAWKKILDKGYTTNPDGVTAILPGFPLHEKIITLISDENPWQAPVNPHQENLQKLQPHIAVDTEQFTRAFAHLQDVITGAGLSMDEFGRTIAGVSNDAIDAMAIAMRGLKDKPKEEVLSGLRNLAKASKVADEKKIVEALQPERRRRLNFDL